MISFFSSQIKLFSQISQAWNLDSCINQLLSITHEMFDERYEDSGVFPTKSNAFDKVWYKGFIIALKKTEYLVKRCGLWKTS